MPFSRFKYKNLSIEFRDPRIPEMVAAMEEFDRPSSPVKLPAGVSRALQGWKEECELPPGCITIKLDPVLETEGHLFEWISFLTAASHQLRHHDDLLAQKYEVLRDYLKNDALRECREPMVVYG